MSNEMKMQQLEIKPGHKFIHSFWVSCLRCRGLVECEVMGRGRSKKSIRYRSLQDDRVGECKLSDFPKQVKEIE